MRRRRQLAWRVGVVLFAAAVHILTAAALEGVSNTEDLAARLPSFVGVRVIEKHPGGFTAEYFPNGTEVCDSWIFVPAENLWHPVLRSIVYFVFLGYLFVGVAIFSDAFMGAIEMMTADVETTVIDADTGAEVTVRTTIWNPTVANLTLLALGSSAPEILLNVIETMQTLESSPGELGPSTIVGSAAFNLLVICAICVSSVEKPKKIEEFGVFVITSLSSLLAYVWMVICLTGWTECEITVVEALLTLSFFPLLVLVAYAADTGLFARLLCGGRGGGGGDGSGDTSPEGEGANEQHLTDLSKAGDEEARDGPLSQSRRRSTKVLTAGVESVHGQGGTALQDDLHSMWALMKEGEDSEEGALSQAMRRAMAHSHISRGLKKAKRRPSLFKTGAHHKAHHKRDLAALEELSANMGSEHGAPPTAANPLVSHSQDSKSYCGPSVLEWANETFLAAPDAETATVALVRHGDLSKTVSAKYKVTERTSAASGALAAPISGHLVLERDAASASLEIPIVKRDSATTALVWQGKKKGDGDGGKEQRSTHTSQMR